MAKTFADYVQELSDAQGAVAKKEARDALNNFYNKQMKSAKAGKSRSSSAPTASDISQFKTLKDVADNITGALDAQQLTVERLISDYKTALDIQVDFIKQGGQYFDRFSEGGDFFKAVTKSGERLFKYFGDVKTGQRAFRDTANNMKTFIMVNDQSKDSMAATVGVAKQLGIEADTMTGIFDNAIQSFGMNAESANSLGVSVANLAQQLAVSPRKLAEEFREAQKDLLYDSAKVETIFRKLQFTSRATGVSFSSLTNAFGEAMDNFEGSSSKAGKLNAILGKSVFNSIDLLGKSEEERLETLVSGIRKNLRGGVQNLGKFELRSIAGGLGLSPDDTRRLLMGKTTINEALATKAPKDPRERALNEMAKGANKVNDSFESLAETMRQTFTPVQRRLIEERQALRSAFLDPFKSVTQGTGLENPADILRMVDRGTANTDFTQSGLEKRATDLRAIITQIKEGNIDAARTTIENFQRGERESVSGPRRPETFIEFIKTLGEKGGEKAVEKLSQAAKDLSTAVKDGIGIDVTIFDSGGNTIAADATKTVRKAKE